MNPVNQKFYRNPEELKDGELAGKFLADTIVNDAVFIELK